MSYIPSDIHMNSKKMRNRVVLATMAFPFVVMSTAPAMAQVADNETPVTDETTTVVVEDGQTTVVEDETTTVKEDDTTTDETTVVDDNDDVDVDVDVDVDADPAILEDGASLTIKLIGDDVDGLTLNLISADGNIISSADSDSSGKVTFDLTDISPEEAVYEVQIEGDREIESVSAKVAEVTDDEPTTTTDESETSTVTETETTSDDESDTPTVTETETTTSSPEVEETTTATETTTAETPTTTSDVEPTTSVTDVDTPTAAAASLFSEIDTAAINDLFDLIAENADSGELDAFSGDANDDEVGAFLDALNTALEDNAASEEDNVAVTNDIIDLINSFDTQATDDSVLASIVTDLLDDIDPELAEELENAIADDNLEVTLVELATQINSDRDAFSFTATNTSVITAEVTLADLDDAKTTTTTTSDVDDADDVDDDKKTPVNDEDKKFGPKVKTGGSVEAKGILNLFS